MIAAGEFQVNIQPLPLETSNPIQLLFIQKNFTGDLTAASKGLMLSNVTEIENSAGYVALEKVVGSLQADGDRSFSNISGSCSAVSSG